MNPDDQAPSREKILPEQRVGMAMRRAREVSSVSLRQMASRLGYNSHTTLSSYERGAVMPTDEVVQGYEKVLSLEPGALVSLLEEARVERHGDTWAKRRIHVPTEFVPSQPLEKPAKQPEVQSSRRRRRRLTIGVGILAIVVVAALITVRLTLYHHHPHSGPSIPVAAISALDQKDPKITGCAIGAVTADQVDVYNPPEHLAGVLELRVSKRCGTSWGRFTPTVGLGADPKVTFEIDVYRPADGVIAKFSLPDSGLPTYGNMLVSSYECTYAQITIIR